MTNKRIRTGKWGESIAVDFLQENGFRILERNYRSGYGEVDIIAQKDQAIVFFEVKTRTNRAFGLPEDTITAAKRTHLEATAQMYMQEHPEYEGECRIDVLAIEIIAGSENLEITWFENAI